MANKINSALSTQLCLGCKSQKTREIYWAGCDAVYECLFCGAVFTPVLVLKEELKQGEVQYAS